MTALSGPLAVHRFRQLWLASILSNVGSFLQSVAAGWLMLELTGSPVWVAAMAASTTLPLLVLALPAGALADLANRRNVLLGAQIAMGVSVGVMAVSDSTGLVTPGLLLGLGLLLGVGVAFNAPTWQAIVPDLVPRQLVASAVALNSVSFNVARVVGPALGGVIVATAGAGTAFAINSVTYIGVIVVLLRFRPGDWATESESSLAAAMALGVRYARHTPTLRWLLGIAAGFAMTSSASQVLLPNLTADELGGDAWLYGALLGAMGVGAVVGAATRDLVVPRLGRRTVPAGITIFGVSGVALGLAPNAPLAGLAMAFGGLAWVWTLATLNASVQLLSHPWIRGRALSLYTLSFVGLTPLGSLLAGGIAEGLGVAPTIVVLSGGALLLGLAAMWMPIVGLIEIEAHEAAEEWDAAPHGDEILVGGPVMVLNTWVIDESDLAEFLDALTELRRVRLQTGAYRWRLYRNADDPHQMTEVFLVPSWDDHLRQHRRIDAAAADVIRRAQTFDSANGPTSRHLVAFDVGEHRNRPDWSVLAAQHRSAHSQDGSVRLDFDEEDVGM
ncbi:MAG TPA: MFS transporter [Acidimicrobiia bacterium]|nr:MFS transporter [Acidimicrobiia bacterium]